MFGENVSAVLQRKMPVKCKDRGMFAIPCKIGHLGIKKAMCDLGASINVMPYSIYESLKAVLDVNRVDIIDSSVEKTFESSYGDKPKMMFDDFESVNKLLAPMNTKLLPPVVQAPDLKLNPLPEHLKCTFLENDETIADLKGISLLEENMEPKKEAQGRLNPNMVDVLKNENFQAHKNKRIQLEQPQ
ncbi:hypothetical protein PVK06_009776 [Gossypium arboreum]|uniref:Uncharacterized protein n=1 Tax=Gossypium arboreum TaxID=29729 RepID=A0ABR0QNF9_GOSAR|nr:hypothetical protein PVK06_009776 [Gossypium arboreum]